MRKRNNNDCWVSLAIWSDRTLTQLLLVENQNLGCSRGCTAGNAIASTSTNANISTSTNTCTTARASTSADASLFCKQQLHDIDGHT